MKVGDTKVVSLEGFAVGEAVVEDISDGKVTLYIPATRVQFALRQELDVPAPEVDRAMAGTTEPAGTNESEASASADNNVEQEQSLRNADLDSSAVD